MSRLEYRTPTLRPVAPTDPRAQAISLELIDSWLPHEARVRHGITLDGAYEVAKMAQCIFVALGDDDPAAARVIALNRALEVVGVNS